MAVIVIPGLIIRCLGEFSVSLNRIIVDRETRIKIALLVNQNYPIKSGNDVFLLAVSRLHQMFGALRAK